MRVEQTPLKDCLIIHNQVINDSRGYFFESFNSKKFEALTGIAVHFVQDNQSCSSKGVLRGLHFQTGEHAQAKLVRVLQGSVLDVVVDMRKDSPSFMQHFIIELTENSNTQLYIPRGMAHGFLVLSDTAVFFYKCDNFYNQASEGGIIYNDPALHIDWQFPEDELILSDKDRHNPTFEAVTNSLP